jgi:undecaprenyl-diphosphatase
MLETSHAVILGAIQGITEYLPVSSSAHLVLTPRFLGVTELGLAFDVFLHLGTLGATVAYFGRDWVGMFREFFARFQKRGLRGVGDSPGVTLEWLAIATLPALVVGALLHSQIQTIFRGNGTIATALVLGGLALWGIDQWRSRREAQGTSIRSMKDMKRIDALKIGLFQCLALVPGMSRSGSTLIGARVLGMERSEGARVSFLMSAPVTLAAVVFEARHFQALLETQESATHLLLSAGSSFLFGVLAIGFLLKVLKKFGFFVFALYRCLVAILVIQFLGV